MSYGEFVTASVVQQALKGPWMFNAMTSKASDPLPSLFKVSKTKMPEVTKKQPKLETTMQQIKSRRLIVKPKREELNKTMMAPPIRTLYRSVALQDPPETKKVRKLSDERLAQRAKRQSGKMEILLEYKTLHGVTVPKSEASALSEQELLIRLHRKHVMHQQAQAALKIQTFYRMHTIRCTYKELKEIRNEAARTI